MNRATFHCQKCQAAFMPSQKRLVSDSRRRGSRRLLFCSIQCHNATKRRATKVTCDACGKTFEKQASQLKRSALSFCSRSCAARYHNTHKTCGFRKSKAEGLLVAMLRTDWPELPIRENDRTLVPGGLEVDVYLPGAAIAVEINGPLHYEPIFGQEKLNRIVQADIRKREHLISCGITMLIIDVRAGKSPARVRRIVTDAYELHVKPLIEERQGPNRTALSCPVMTGVSQSTSDARN